ARGGAAFSSVDGMAGPAAARFKVSRDFIPGRLRPSLAPRDPARHIAVERRIADAGLALVAGRKDQRAEFVRERHQDVAANARLDVLFRDPHGGSAENGLRLSQYRLKGSSIGMMW